MLHQVAPSALPWIATVTVGVAPITEVIVSSAAPCAPDRSNTLVDAPVPVWDVDRFAVLTPPWPVLRVANGQPSDFGAAVACLDARDERPFGSSLLNS